jgi:uncharacterized membrane protein YuzA (DUF378 family)
VDDRWEVIAMKLLFGVVLFIVSFVGMVVSFFSRITVNSSLALLNGLEMSIELGIFFILTGLAGLYMIINHN